MKEKDTGRTGRFVLALVLGVILALFASSALRGRLGGDKDAGAPGDLASGQPAPLDMAPAALEATLARRYAQAMQEQHWDFVIDHTLWMQERLARAVERGEEAAAARAALKEDLGERNQAGNQLGYAGIEDKYVFSPSAILTAVSADTGRQDLERPATMRVWILAEYPEPAWAPHGPDGRSIRALLAGVNTTADGFVLKANVIGNLDIDWTAITYAPSQE